ncbi:hypothetical protein ABW20_dc0104347 [Dactylellina cionopaga]|nr:hypothetical protein ABW20_dc0104347 [Dactylellina cionopaga]
MAYLEALQDAIIIEILGAGALVTDFGQPADPGYNIFGVINGALGIAAGLSAGSPIASGALSALSGAFGILALGPDTPPDNIRNDIDARLAMAFKASREQIFRLAETIFGGQSDTSMLRSLSPSAIPNGEKTDVGRFFSGGRFLIPSNVKLDMEVRGLVDAGAKMIRQSLVIFALKSQGYFIWIDTDATTFESCTPTGSRFMNGKCYKLTKARETRLGFDDIPVDTALKLVNAQYGLNVEQFYANAEACQIAFPNGDGQVQTQGLPSGGALPQCFFNMRVITGKKCVTACSPLGACSQAILPQCP